MASDTLSKNICTLANCRFSYRHFYDYHICGSQNGGSSKQPLPLGEEPLADWEKELLKPDPNLVIHIYPAEGMTACDIKLDDGNTHAVNSKIENVSCGDCRINYLTYVNEQLNADLAKKQEELRVSQQAYTSQHRELTNLRRRREQDATTMRRMREDIAYLRDGGYYEAGHSGYPPVRRPVPRYPY